LTFWLLLAVVVLEDLGVAVVVLEVTELRPVLVVVAQVPNPRLVF
jgi:hypothetical protein